MRILTLTSLYPNSVNLQHGIFVETRVRELLKRHPVELRVIAPVPWFPFRSSHFGKYATYAAVPQQERLHGIDVLHPRYLVLPKVGMHLAPWTLARSACRLIDRLLQEGYDFDILDAHYFYPDGVAAAIVARRFNRPFVVTARGSDINVIPKDPRAHARMCAAAEQASALVAVSPALRDRMIALGFPSAKIEVLRNGVDTQLFRPDCRLSVEIPALSGSRRIVFVGNLVSVKAPDLALRAMVRLPDAHLVMVGTGELRGALEKLAESLGVAGRVSFMGRLPQNAVAGVMASADVLLMTSLTEGWPNVLLEAMACGTPVAVAPFAGVEAIVTEPTAGQIAASHKADDLATAVRSVIDRGTPRTEVRAYAERFGWAQTVDRLFELFSEIVHRGIRSQTKGLPSHVQA